MRYQALGAEPVLLAHDAVSYGMTADELVTTDAPKADTYRILVHSSRGAGSYDLEVEMV